MNNKIQYGALGFVLVIILGIGAYLFYTGYIGGMTSGVSPSATITDSASSTDAVAAKIDSIYDEIASLHDLPWGGSVIINALSTFRDIAADGTNSPLDRAKAINGINYLYTVSVYDASDVYNEVFSKPPFSAYYQLSSSTPPVDPVHPRSGHNVAAVESALLSLSQISNELAPNHYAISRMEVLNIWAFDRALAITPVSQQAPVIADYVSKEKAYIASYDALPPLQSFASSYPFLIQMQIMFSHASALASVGKYSNDQSYLDRGESLFKDTIAKGDSYTGDPKSTEGIQILSQTLLTRIFYASGYWNEYKTSDPEKIENILLPLTDVANVSNTLVYTSYLPGQKDATVPPFSVLREIATKMPALKTFLQGVGWNF